MKNSIIYTIVFLFILYISAAIQAGNFNPLQWSPEARILFAIVFFLQTIGVLLAWKKQTDVKKAREFIESISKS